jgi:quercetin dioxygenase-like cupin family protein
VGEGDPGALRLYRAGETRELTAPSGTRITFADPSPPVAMPPLQPEFLVSRRRDAEWQIGRAGMRYRDLAPGRQGGWLIASEIRIPGGGPVPDYVHYHRVRFQMIYCARGWVRVVYEDQGPPFVMQPGDCVLQPPEIRHRVLESGPDVAVIEVGCPAGHETWADHELTLPTASVRPGREFGGQRFLRHQAAGAPWTPRPGEGFEARDTGVSAATGGIAAVSVLRPAGEMPGRAIRHADPRFLFVLEGRLQLSRPDREVERLDAGDAVVIPAGTSWRWGAERADLELLEVSLPGEPRKP